MVNNRYLAGDMRIGMLGGTFNPIHMGHLALAQECRRCLSLDKVVFIPAYSPPHKDVEYRVSAVDRLNMVHLCVDGDSGFEISTYEIDKQGTSYTVETIEHFRDKYGRDARLFFLTGSDSAKDLSTWREVDRILSMTTFVIASRPGWDMDTLFDEKVTRVLIPRIDVSSTVVRDRVRNNEPVDHLVPPAVVRYIREKGLYKASGPNGNS